MLSWSARSGRGSGSSVFTRGVGARYTSMTDALYDLVCFMMYTSIDISDIVCSCNVNVSLHRASLVLLSMLTNSIKQRRQIDHFSVSFLFAQPGSANGHALLRSRMEVPPSITSRLAMNRAGVDQMELAEDAGGDAYGNSDELEKRTRFVQSVLEWYMCRGLKTALLDVGMAVPVLTCQFLANRGEQELLWIFEVQCCTPHPGF